MKSAPRAARPFVLVAVALLVTLAAGRTPRLFAAADATAYATIDEAIARGDLADVQRHLRRDPAAARGKPGDKLAPLHSAILRKQAKIALLLLDHGADVQAPDNAGRTPLHLAVERDEVGLARELLRRKADPGRRDRTGWTPLHHAAAKTRLAMATVLLEAGANPNLLSELGGTPLHEAAASGSVEMVRLLLAHGVDPAVVSKSGATALSLAREYQHPAVVTLLSERQPAR